MTRAWAIRHGESTANIAFAAPGIAAPLPGRDSDVELSTRGRAQARTLRRWWTALSAAERPNLVVCSPYTRARQTWAEIAEVAGAAAPTVVVDSRVRDREMGVFELFPPTVIESRAPAEAARRVLVGEWFYRPPGGESLADVELRVRSLVSDLERDAPGATVLIVGHDATVVCLRQVFAGVGAALPQEFPPVPNASVSCWSHEDSPGLRLRLWGATEHLLEDGPTTPSR